MKSILVVDDMAVFSEPIAASLRLSGYETQCAVDGEQALQITRTTHPDVILLDIEMPTMDGITFLKRLRAEPAIANTHVILLTVHSEKNQILAAGCLGVRDFVLKSRFHLNDLLERIKKFDAPAASNKAQAAPRPCGGDSKPKGLDTPPGKKNVEVPRLLSRDQFLERVERVFQTKTLSGVVVEVIAMASSPKGDTAQLAALISRDPMLSARVLQAANSALYASAGAVVTTIRDAIRKVGYTAVRNIAAALGVFGCMPDAGTDGFNPIRCWQHSFAVAQLCERLATEKFADQSGLAYLVGLCHDLGDIFIRTEFGKEYQQVIEMSAQSGRPKEQLHGQMLGMTTAQMISAVLKCMSLPDAIRKPIEMLHSPAGSQLTDPLARILWMGENYANAAMLASSPSSEVAPLTQSFCRAAVGQPNPSRPDPQTLRSQVLSLTVALARLSRAEESQLLAPMFKTQTAKLWIARDTGISEFDPVGLALESLSKVAVQNRLPTEKEIAEISGLVVVASSANTVGFSRRDIESALGKVRSAGRTLPVLAVSCSGASTENQAEEISWRASVTLAELAAFAEKLVKDTPAQAA
jgi:HD-like signal output (HDOD) protein/ActR/RegA family two-component response regulator